MNLYPLLGAGGNRVTKNESLSSLPQSLVLDTQPPELEGRGREQNEVSP